MERELTFGDLEKLIEQWAWEVEEYKRTFANQFEGLNEVHWMNLNNQKKICVANLKLELLRDTNEQLEKNLAMEELYQNMLEQLITNIEMKIKPLNESAATDDNRNELYKLAKKINYHLIWCKEMFESINMDVQEHDRERLHDRVEQIARVMTRLLELLQYIESRTGEMKTRICLIEHAYKMLH